MIISVPLIDNETDKAQKFEVPHWSQAKCMYLTLFLGFPLFPPCDTYIYIPFQEL